MTAPVVHSALLPVTLAKTARPRTVRAGVERRRLFRALDAAVREAVTVICAGPGWGKTMLVSAWAQSREARVAWLSLDRHDNDPALFWAYVLAALRVADALPADNPLAGMSSVPADERERGRRLSAGLSRLPEPTVLVLDDFHEIDDPQILRELNDLLRHPPDHLRIVMVTRVEPPMALHRLRAGGHVTEIRADQLAFTGEEAADLVGRHGLSLPPGELTSLLERTEGWAVGLHLGAGFLADPAGGRSIAEFAGDVRGISEYLTEEVLAARSRRQRRFLLQTSICERICADLANAITAQGDAQHILEQLEHDNDFVVRLGARPLWFRYHHLLREALGHRLQRDTPSATTELHRRAARWYAGNNSVMEALNHAAAARDWQYIGRVVTTHAAPLIVSVHRPALVKILGRIPVDRLGTTPELIVCSALLLFHAGDFGAIPARIGKARALLRRRADDSGRRDVEITLYMLEWTADRACGDMPAVVDGTARMLDLLAAAPADGAAQAQQRAIALANRGLARLWTGDAGAAGRDLWAGLSAARAAGVELAELNATGHLALLQVLCGSVHEAAGLAAAAADLAELRGWSYTLQAVAAHVAQALVALERHDLEAAEQGITRAIRAHHGDREPTQLLAILGAQARLSIARGEPGRAHLFLDEARRHRNPRLRAGALDEWLSIIGAEADLEAGRYDTVAKQFAGVAVGPMFELAARVVRARAAWSAGAASQAGQLLTVTPQMRPQTAAEVAAGVLGALLADAHGDATQAGDLLAQAVTVAAREGIRRPFATFAGGHLDDLLDRLRLLHPSSTPAVDAIRNDVRGTPAPAPTGPALSERETEVLRYLPTMLTAAQIAAELGVSVNTVKAHMRAIYRKLGAARRSEAVGLARDHAIL